MRSLLTFLLLSLFVLMRLEAQGIEFMEGDWKAALAEAKKEKKLIFVDAYASWCGPCKRMAQTVFTRKEAGAFFNEKFINFKIDMEKGEGPAFGDKYPVRAYPTLMFIDYNGELVYQKVGAQQLASLLQLGELALRKIDRSAAYANQYEQGDRSAALVYDYLLALNQAGKPSLKIANDYLREPEGDLSAEINLRIIFEALLQLDSRVYTLFDQHNQEIKALYPQEAIDERLLSAAYRTMETAINFEWPAILAEAQQKVAAHASEAVAMAFRVESELAYAHAHADDATFAAALRDYNRTLAGRADINRDYAVVKKALDRLGSKKIDKAVKALMKTITEYPDITYQIWLAYADVLTRTGDNKAAQEALDEARDLVEDKRILARIAQLREQLEENQ